MKWLKIIVAHLFSDALIGPKNFHVKLCTKSQLNRSLFGSFCLSKLWFDLLVTRQCHPWTSTTLS